MATRPSIGGILSPKHAHPTDRLGLSSIRVDYGPRDLFGRFLLMADYALRELGVTVSLGTFDELVATNERNRDSWLPLIPTFNPTNGLCHPDRGYVLIGRNSEGRIVTAMGTVIFDWTGSTFRTEAGSMRLFYAEPDKRARPEERCIVTAASAGALTGKVAFLGGGWWHPSVRGQLLGTLLSRVSRTYAYTRWNPDLVMAIMSERLIEKGFGRRNGYPHSELGVGFRNFEMGTYDGGVVWITPGELFSDLSEFMVTLESSLNNRGGLRTA